MQHLVDRLQQDRGSNLHGLRPHCGGSDVRREFAWKTSQSRTCSRSARGTSIAWNGPRKLARPVRNWSTMRLQSSKPIPRWHGREETEFEE